VGHKFDTIIVDPDTEDAIGISGVKLGTVRKLSLTAIDYGTEESLPAWLGEGAVRSLRDALTAWLEYTEA
jgi:hypothetical protein